jgi:hypothetical protein
LVPATGQPRPLSIINTGSVGDGHLANQVAYPSQQGPLNRIPAIYHFSAVHNDEGELAAPINFPRSAAALLAVRLARLSASF